MIKKHLKFSSRREAYLIIFLLIIIVVYLSWTLAAKYIYSDIKEQHEQLRLICQEKERLMAIRNQGREIKAEWTLWQDKKDPIEENIHIQDDLPFVLVNLRKYFNSLPGTVHNMQVGQTTDHQLYSSTGIKLDISAQASRTKRLLQQIDNCSYFLLINSINWSQSSQEEARLNITLKLILLKPFSVETAHNNLGLAIDEDQ